MAHCSRLLPDLPLVAQQPRGLVYYSMNILLITINYPQPVVEPRKLGPTLRLR
jgi:hypothetical protein